MRLGVFGLSLMLAQPVWAEDGQACHPVVDVGQAQFLVGYGSLMQIQSRQRTTVVSGAGIPVRVSGYVRGWNVRGSLVDMTTYLGVTPNLAGRFNAALYRMPDRQEVLATDLRESGYCRVQVAPNQIEMLGLDAPPTGQVWLYRVRDGQAMLPDRAYPIVQSYVDVFLSGCMEVGEESGVPDFAAECVQSTQDWPQYWVNDRIMPRRPALHQPLAGRIDRLLERWAPEALKARVIE